MPSPAGYEQLTVSTAVVGLASVPGTSNMAVIRVATANVRYRDDGTDPSATVGQRLLADEVLTYTNDPSQLEFIRSGGADAVLDVLYYS